MTRVLITGCSSGFGLTTISVDAFRELLYETIGWNGLQRRGALQENK